MCLTPCKQCAFRKDSIPGYFGGHDQSDFKNSLKDESVVPCHVRSKYDGNDNVKEIVACRGQVLSQIVSCKSSMNPLVVKAKNELLKHPRIDDLKANALSVFNFDEHHSKEIGDI